MRSIRRSLIVYFLALMALALGVIGGLVYRTTIGALRDKEESMRQLLLANYKKSCDEENHRWEEIILHRARTLARLAELQFGDPFLREARPLGYLFFPRPYELVRLWEWPPRNSFSQQIRNVFAIQIQMTDAVFPRDDEAAGTQYYFQTYSGAGRTVQKSTSLGTNEFALNPGVREKLPLLECEFDEVQLTAETRVLRVTYRSPIVRTQFTPNPRPREMRGGGPHGSPSRNNQPPPQGPVVRSSPEVFVQVACDTRERDARLSEFEGELYRDLDRIEDDSQVRMAQVRDRLLGLSLAVFAATIVGGWSLVKFGLTPLHRLSEAVSQVSAKDFRLPLDDKAPMPAELRPIVDRLKETLHLLQKAFAREKQAAADISHELRTPLAALLATTSVALRKDRTPAEYRTIVQECQASGRQMNQLVERLLALARLDAGVDLLRPQDVDIGSLAETCTGMVQPLARAHDLKLEFHCKQPVTARTDPDKLREVLSNLLHNAIEYNRPGGSIDVNVERHNGSLALEVCDTGIGISPEAREHVFERFYRADPSRQADGLHAGLGLAITKKYVELLGGTIGVDSKLGEGSRFRIELPIG